MTLVAISAGLVATGTPFASSLGIGLSAALWGGAGLGATIGVVHADRLAEPTVYRSIVGTVEDRAPALLRCGTP